LLLSRRGTFEVTVKIIKGQMWWVLNNQIHIPFYSKYMSQSLNGIDK
jgi:hypothetical protein